jgi:Plasmid pRiA4b ORF-3-like protein
MSGTLGAVRSGDAILQLRITVRGTSEPTIWRRLLVPEGIRLDRLHTVIQRAMGWRDYHLHCFSDGAREFGPQLSELEHCDERKASLRRLLEHAPTYVLYTYDFGDRWEHEIVLERTLEAQPGTRYPVCLAGAGACPPEDCGGVPGYAQLREALGVRSESAAWAV